MTLDEFVQQLHLDVTYFKSDRILESQKDPTSYPLEMDEEMWVREFVSHISAEH